MSTMPMFASDRMFEVWRYTVSHRQLLIRSNKGNASATRLEILFKNVAYMALPPVMNGLRISACKAGEELPDAARVVGISKPWYRIESDGLVGYVAAGAVVTNEDELDYEEPSSILSGPML